MSPWFEWCQAQNLALGRPEKMSEVVLTLNVFDGAGEMTGEAKTVSLSLEAVADIIDHATQLSILEEKELDTSVVLDELAEALEVHGLSDGVPSARLSLPTP